MSEEVLIDGIPLTKSWLQDQIERKHGVRPRVGKVEPLGPDAIGYLSIIRRVHLEWNSEQIGLPASVIVKIPCSAAADDAFESSGANIELSGRFIRACHGLETKFYRLMQDEKGKRLLVPTIYAAEDFSSEQPVIVMEDYRKCFITDLVEGLSEKQLFAIAEQIANLQVLSIRNRQWITILQPEGRAMLDEINPKLSSQLRSACQKLMEEMPELLSCLKTFMANTIEQDPDWITKFAEPYYSGEKPSVLIHGDLWIGQILWRDANTIAGVIDWQCIRQGSPVEDFLRLLSTSTTSEKRRELLHPLLDYYYDKMKEQLGADMPFSREHLNDELKFIWPLSCIASIFLVSFYSKSEASKKNGVLDQQKTSEIARRCRAFVEDAAKLCEWPKYHE